MPIITELQVQKKNNERVSLFLDGEFRCGLSKISVLTYRLKVGSELSEARLAEILQESEVQIAFDRSLALLERYVKTERQMKDYLVQKGFAPSVADGAIDRLKRYGYIDDATYARFYVENGIRQKGKRRLQQELRQKGIERDLTEEILSDVQEEVSVAVAEGLKYLRGAPVTDRAVKAKVYRHLAARGFESETILSALRQMSEGVEEDE